MSSKNKPLSPAVWQYSAQFFVGLFFLAAAYLKATKTFFGAAQHPLHDVFEYWLRIDWPVHAFRPLMEWGTAHAGPIAVAMILGQGLLGLLLIFNVGMRFAGLLLIAIHIPLFLSVFHQPILHVLIFQTFWVGLFYLLQGRLTGRGWTVMTYLLVCIGLLFLWYRAHVFDDLAEASAFWQRAHFSEYVMSLTVGIKHTYLWLTAGSVGSFFWVFSWWFKLLLTVGMLTRFRLQSAAVLLTYLILQTMVWMSEWTCEGVFWVLIVFVWITHEYALQQHSKKPPVSFLP